MLSIIVDLRSLETEQLFSLVLTIDCPRNYKQRLFFNAVEPVKPHSSNRAQHRALLGKTVVRIQAEIIRKKT